MTVFLYTKQGIQLTSIGLDLTYILEEKFRDDLKVAIGRYQKRCHGLIKKSMEDDPLQYVYHGVEVEDVQGYSFPKERIARF